MQKNCDTLFISKTSHRGVAILSTVVVFNLTGIISCGCNYKIFKDICLKNTFIFN
jgi:hypothetical protein